MKVFVFGSNLAGRHGAGSAKEALKHGARRGVGRGRCGASYAIPTKGFSLEVLPLERIDFFVREFKEHAAFSPADEFIVVAIGCGLAGYTPAQIAPMFRDAPSNVHLPTVFATVLAQELIQRGRNEAQQEQSK